MTGGERALGFLGLCAKAGQAVSGQEQCVAEIRSGRAALALIDADASPNTKKRVGDACAAHQVPLYELAAGELGSSIGRTGRMVATLCAGGMSERMKRLLEER